MCILLYVKLSGIPYIYGVGVGYIALYMILLYVNWSGIHSGQLEEGAWYMCILLYVKLIWCSGIPQIYGQLEGVHLP